MNPDDKSLPAQNLKMIEGMRDQVHDCFLDITGVKSSEEQITIIAEKVPTDIKGLAFQWGWFDTEVREKLYLWLESEYLNERIDT